MYSLSISAASCSCARISLLLLLAALDGLPKHLLPEPLPPPLLRGVDRSSLREPGEIATPVAARLPRGGEWERKPPPMILRGTLSGTIVPLRAPYMLFQESRIKSTRRGSMNGGKGVVETRREHF